jgi:hypothetical protein
MFRKPVRHADPNALPSSTRFSVLKRNLAAKLSMLAQASEPLSTCRFEHQNVLETSGSMGIKLQGLMI